MKLYKNVDIIDLESILKLGILSMDKCGNNNWDERKRTNNATDIVYLFSPKSEVNSFPEYGVALIEVDVDNATEYKMDKTDVHIGKYVQYVVDKVEPQNIINIYIPSIFKSKLDIPTFVLNKIIWCEMEADYYDDGGNLVPCSTQIISQFAKTALIKNSNSFNFFRGIDSKRCILDIYNIRYNLIGGKRT